MHIWYQQIWKYTNIQIWCQGSGLHAHLVPTNIKIYKYTNIQIFKYGGRGLGYMHIWYLYTQAALQLLQVGNCEPIKTLNTKHFIIYFITDEKNLFLLSPSYLKYQLYESMLNCWRHILDFVFKSLSFFVMMQVMNSAQNLPIYWNVGTGFKTTLRTLVGYIYIYIYIYIYTRSLGPIRACLTSSFTEME